MTTAFQGSNHVLFAEPFEDTSFATRGWYDSDGGLAIDSTVFSPRQGGGAIKFHFGIGDTAPVTPRRHLFTATDTLYISFDIKLGTAGVPWQGSGAIIDPHLIEILTDADISTAVPGFSFLTTYIESLQFIPLIGLSDGARTNVPQVGIDLMRSATTHAVAGSNGVPFGSNFSEFHANGDGTYSNWSEWTYGNPGTGRGDGTSYFVNNTWHRVEVFLKMNSIFSGAPVGDGILRMTVDGNKLIDFTNIELRTAQYPTQKFNQFVLAPTMSLGSPIAQDLWIDNLLVADAPPDDDSGDFSFAGGTTSLFIGGPVASGLLLITSATDLQAVGTSTTGGEPIYCYDMFLRSDADRLETPLSYNPHLVSCLAKIPLQDGDIGSGNTSDMQMLASSIAVGDWVSDGVGAFALGGGAVVPGVVVSSGTSTLVLEGFATGTLNAEITMNGVADMQMVGFFGLESGAVLMTNTSECQFIGSDGAAVVIPPSVGFGTGDEEGATAGRNPWYQQRTKRRKIIAGQDDELVVLVKELASKIYLEET